MGQGLKLDAGLSQTSTLLEPIKGSRYNKHGELPLRISSTSLHRIISADFHSLIYILFLLSSENLSSIHSLHFKIQFTPLQLSIST
jgi:hypothetical protein